MLPGCVPFAAAHVDIGAEVYAKVYLCGEVWCWCNGDRQQCLSVVVVLDVYAKGYSVVLMCLGVVDVNSGVYMVWKWCGRGQSVVL